MSKQNRKNKQNNGTNKQPVVSKATVVETEQTTAVSSEAQSTPAMPAAVEQDTSIVSADSSMESDSGMESAAVDGTASTNDTSTRDGSETTAEVTNVITAPAVAEVQPAAEVQLPPDFDEVAQRCQNLLNEANSGLLMPRYLIGAEVLSKAPSKKDEDKKTKGKKNKKKDTQNQDTQDQDKTWGKAVVKKLGDWVGLSVPLLYRYRRVAETLPQDEFEALAKRVNAKGVALTWTHFELVTQKHVEKDRRDSLLDAAISEGLSSGELEKRIGTKGGQKALPPAPSPTEELEKIRHGLLRLVDDMSRTEELVTKNVDRPDGQITEKDVLELGKVAEHAAMLSEAAKSLSTRCEELVAVIDERLASTPPVLAPSAANEGVAA